MQTVIDWLKQHWGNTLWVIILLAFLGNIFYCIAPVSQPSLTLQPAEITNSGSNTAVNDEAELPADTAETASPHQSRHYAKKQLGKVHINTASVSQLQHLPGVGIKMAGRIVTYRKQIGRFSSCDELNNVSGIGPKKLAKMKPYCLL